MTPLLIPNSPKRNTVKLLVLTLRDGGDTVAGNESFNSYSRRFAVELASSTHEEQPYFFNHPKAKSPDSCVVRKCS
jgi:hypothetical protein